MTTAAQAILYACMGHPSAFALLIGLVTVIVFIVGAVTVSKYPHGGPVVTIPAPMMGSTPSSPSAPTSSKAYWNPPSYVGVEHVGRRIESAIYAGLAGTADVKTRIEAL